MQLKRDTDYALRIILYIGVYWPEREQTSEGFSLSEISSQTSVPRISADRICGYLKDSDILSSVRTGTNELLYHPGKDFYDRSLLDVINAAEDGVQLFAGFDRKSLFYRERDETLRRIQESVDETLSRITIRQFLDGEKDASR